LLGTGIEIDSGMQLEKIFNFASLLKEKVFSLKISRQFQEIFASIPM